MNLRMEHIDTGSIKGFTITSLLGVFSLWTKSDIAVYITIMAGVTTIIVNIVKLINSREK
jgi:hypothetical protein